MGTERRPFRTQGSSTCPGQLFRSPSACCLAQCPGDGSSSYSPMAPGVRHTQLAERSSHGFSQGQGRNQAWAQVLDSTHHFLCSQVSPSFT